MEVNEIQTVKLMSEGYLLNGSIFVPNAPGNRHYNAIQEWIALGNTPDPEKTPEEELDEAKAIKKIEIREAFLAEAKSPVTSNTVSYNGGIDSVLRLDTVIRLAEAAGASDVTIYDINNVGQVLTINDAKTVVSTISQKYQQDLAQKQSLFTQIDAATSVAEVDAIVWT